VPLEVHSPREARHACVTVVVVSGWYLVVGGWELVVGGWGLGVGGWWLGWVKTSTAETSSIKAVQRVIPNLIYSSSTYYYYY
jgi:hypothetical protein